MVRTISGWIFELSKREQQIVRAWMMKSTLCFLRCIMLSACEVRRDKLFDVIKCKKNAHTNKTIIKFCMIGYVVFETTY